MKKNWDFKMLSPSLNTSQKYVYALFEARSHIKEIRFSTLIFKLFTID